MNDYDYNNNIVRKVNSSNLLSWIALGLSALALAFGLTQRTANEQFKEEVSSLMHTTTSSAQAATDAALKAQALGKDAAVAAQTTAANAAQASADSAEAERLRQAALNAANKAAAAASVARTAAASAETSAKSAHAVTLPGGGTLEITEGSSVEGLYNVLSNPNADLTQAIHVGDINFETDSATLTLDSMSTIDQFVSVLKAFPTATIRIEGHTDTVGDATYNLKLSADRARSVMTELARRGIAGGRIEAKGYGQERPIASNDTLEGQALNRRVDVIVLKR